MHPPILSEISWVYNPQQLDAYLVHLASIYARCTVTAAEDIYSECNSLLLRRGLVLTPAVAQAMLPFTLRKPLEDSICLSAELDEKKLLSDLASVRQQDEILFALNEHLDFSSLLKAFCPLIIQSALLRQKLTVMSYAMPDLYRRSLYCTWLSLCIAKEMRLSRDDIAIVFMAALSHDIGMLHIDSALLQKTSAISPSEWICIQRHVVIGQRLLKTEKNIPAAVAQAVYEHHEQSDGSGYPLAKLENELGLFGQILNVADAIIAIYFHCDSGRSWREVIPLIQMNSQAYFTRVNEVLLAIVRRADLPQKNVVQGDLTPDFIADMLDNNEQLKLWFDHMRESLLTIGFRHGDRRLHTLQSVMLHLATAAEGSGIFHANRAALLSGTAAESSHLAVLNPELQGFAQGDGGQLELPPLDLSRQCEKMHLMQQEIIFHLQRLSRMTHLYLESGECKNEDIKCALSRSLQSAKNNGYYRLD